MARDLRASISPAHYDAFVAFLTRSRTSLMDGLTPRLDKCAHASEAQFASLRDFVWAVRRFYLLRADVPAAGAHSSPQPSTTTALWNHVEAYRFPHVGDGYFAIMALLLQNAMCEEYASHPFVKRARYASVNVDTDYERITGPASELARRSVDPVTHSRTLLRDMPSAAHEWHRVRIRLHRPSAADIGGGGGGGAAAGSHGVKLLPIALESPTSSPLPSSTSLPIAS